MRWTRFLRIRSIERRSEAAAAAAIAASVRHLRDKQAQLEQLCAFAEDYARASGRGVADPARWHNLQAFLVRLDGVIKALEAEVERGARSMQVHTECWRRAHRRAKAMERLASRYRREALRHALRAEEKEIEEMVSRTRTDPG